MLNPLGEAEVTLRPNLAYPLNLGPRQAYRQQGNTGMFHLPGYVTGFGVWTIYLSVMFRAC